MYAITLNDTTGRLYSSRNLGYDEIIRIATRIAQPECALSPDVLSRRALLTLASAFALNITIAYRQFLHALCQPLQHHHHSALRLPSLPHLFIVARLGPTLLPSLRSSARLGCLDSAARIRLGQHAIPRRCVLARRRELSCVVIIAPKRTVTVITDCDKLARDIVIDRSCI